MKEERRVEGCEKIRRVVGKMVEEKEERVEETGGWGKVGET
jgi:hypothetical protein